jgi:ribonucleotide reductase alpha subunit
MYIIWDYQSHIDKLYETNYVSFIVNEILCPAQMFSLTSCHVVHRGKYAKKEFKIFVEQRYSYASATLTNSNSAFDNPSSCVINRIEE